MSKSLGGLHVIGTERHEARRIDLQLRGRCGRQGDPGSSRFYLSLRDDLMRIFAGPWAERILKSLGMPEGEAIESRMVTRRIEAAQKKVEERNFEVRKNLLEYDEVMDEQRKRVYSYRQQILEQTPGRELILPMIATEIRTNLKSMTATNYGVESFARWASTRLHTQLEPKGLSRVWSSPRPNDLPRKRRSGNVKRSCTIPWKRTCPTARIPPSGTGRPWLPMPIASGT